PRPGFSVEEMKARESYLESLPGAQFKDDIRAMNFCSYTMSHNGVALETHVRQFMGAPILQEELSDDFENELVRLLHNFLASVTSLIDAQRVVMRHRWPDEGQTPKFAQTEYRHALAKYFRPGESEFVVKLRNYCTHRSIVSPGLETTISWEQGGPMMHRNTLTLTRNDLLEWDSWGAAARSYLEGQNESFELAPIVERYTGAARDFYQWFWDEMHRHYAVEQAEYLAKGKEYALWRLENDNRPEWWQQGPKPPPEWLADPAGMSRRQRARRRLERYEFGTHHFNAQAIDANGVILWAEDDWKPLPP
ncbi:hypothetical protein, partial [Mycolicibacterium llatzerense]|uniref:hypothetical protein n=1 Tax=Mycolicibacterium llatzerense TaxID=280871 RepID=UPI0008DE30DD